jgi:hypothetical protein
LPSWRMRFLPSFCFSRSLGLRGRTARRWRAIPDFPLVLNSSDLPGTTRKISTLSALWRKKCESRLRAIISAHALRAKSKRKSLVGSERWRAPAKCRGFVPRGGLKARPLAHLTGRQAVTPSGGASCGSRGRRLVTAVLGRLRASSDRHYDRSGRCIPGLGLAGAGNAHGTARGPRSPVGAAVQGRTSRLVPGNMAWS